MKYIEAKESLLQSLKLGVEEDFFNLQTHPYSGLAMIATEEANYKEAIHYFKEAIDIKSKWGSVAYLAGEFGNIAHVYLKLRELSTAFEYAQQEIIILYSLNDRWRLAAHLNTLGNIYTEIGIPLQSYNCFITAMQFAKDSKNIIELGKILSNLGTLQLRLGHLEYAEESLVTALDIALSKDEKNIGLRIIKLGMLEEYKENYDEAIKKYSIGLSLLYSPYDIISTKANIAGCYAQKGNYESAKEFYWEARLGFEQLGLVNHIDQIDYNLKLVDELQKQAN